ncbi:hypothetical protein BSKO_02277 [Bryopsis sp. KO-2023]|nr:hypothetical protein BSKO_02277 [Bryopsis sp. KO-2023]
MVLIDGNQGFSNGIRKRFDDPEYCDVVVEAENGSVFHCSKFVLRCGSEVFHRMFASDMKEATSNLVKIKDADPKAIRSMLKFMHGGQVDLDDKILLPLSSIAERYQITQLMQVCADFKKRHFRVDAANCCEILEQIYTLDKAPDGVLEHCEDVVRENIKSMLLDISFMNRFVKLPFQAVLGTVKNALPRMFVDSRFPSCYVRLAESLLAWLNGDACAREKHAVTLLGSLEFESLGLEGIASLTNPSVTSCFYKNWVRSYPQLEQKALDGLWLASEKPAVFRRSNTWKSRRSGWFSIVCKGSCSSKLTRGVAIVGQFLISSLDTFHIDIGHNNSGYGRGCTVSVTCSNSNRHVLLAAGGGGRRDDASFAETGLLDKDSGVDGKGLSCGCHYSLGDGLYNSETCAGTKDRGGCSYVCREATEVFQCFTNDSEPSISIFARPGVYFARSQ